MRTPVCTRRTERRSPMKQLGMASEEILRIAIPPLRHAASYAFQVAQRQVLLVLPGYAVGGREAEERLAEARHRIVGVPRQVDEGDAQVLAVADPLFRERRGIECDAKLVVAHADLRVRGYSRATVSTAAA